MINKWRFAKGKLKKTSQRALLLPPFNRETAIQKVRMAEDGWNSRDPEKVALAYTIDSRWRNRSEFPSGRQEIIQFLKRKWAKELDYRLNQEPHVAGQGKLTSDAGGASPNLRPSQ